MLRIPANPDEIEIAKVIGEAGDFLLSSVLVEAGKEEVIVDGQTIVLPPDVSITAFAVDIRARSRKFHSSDGMHIENTKLVDLIVEAGGSREWGERAALLANMHLPSMKTVQTDSEMLLQHSVYNAISELFLAFCPADYRVNQGVKCSHYFFAIGDSATPMRSVGCMPDGAISLSGRFDVAAMMKLKPVEGPRAGTMHDEFKCILMTVVSILGLERARKRAAQDQQPPPQAGLQQEGQEVSVATSGAGTAVEMDHGLAIPFIIGRGSAVRLFAMRLTNKSTCPFVERLYAGNLDGGGAAKAAFVSILAVLLSDILAHCQPSVISVIDTTPDLECDHSLSKPKAKSKPKSKQTGDSSQNSGKKRINRDSAQPQKGENEAMTMASLNGTIYDLHVPCFRVKNAALAPWDRDMAYYQQESPFYFKGSLVNYPDNMPVFCKVWREGDSHVDRDDIKDEIDLFNAANSNGVPSPIVIKDLTAMNLSYIREDTMQSVKYHILVTSYERNDPIVQDDLLRFALSLVQAVRNLHACGILHCDIKPGNVLWDMTRGVVRLIDFGHAQYESTARAYHATEKYQAPEISQGESHTRKSDAFGVGKTIEKALETASRVGKNNYPVLELVDELLARDVSVRISLDEAEMRLRRATRALSTIGRFVETGWQKKKCWQKAQIPSSERGVCRSRHSDPWLNQSVDLPSLHPFLPLRLERRARALGCWD
jgi:serine/threonine protein kinase